MKGLSTNDYILRDMGLWFIPFGFQKMNPGYLVDNKVAPERDVWLSHRERGKEEGLVKIRPLLPFP